MIKVDYSILEIGGGGAFLRDVLETMQYQVSFHLIGQPAHLIRELKRAQELGDTIIIACHCGDVGIWFDEYMPEIDVSLLRERQFPFELLFELGQFENKTVINTGCSSAGEAASRAFKPRNGFSYVGYNDDPDGEADLLIMHKLLYELNQGAALDDAVGRTKKVCADAKFLAKLV